MLCFRGVVHQVPLLICAAGEVTIQHSASWHCPCSNDSANCRCAESSPHQQRRSHHAIRRVMLHSAQTELATTRRPDHLYGQTIK